MSISLRVFFFKPDKSIIKIPLSRFDQLFNNDSNESFPEYAGERIKCAIVCVELENRRPVKIINVNYTIVSFSSDGRIDQEKFHSEGALAMQMMDLPDLSLPKNVVDLSPKIARKKYHERFKWTPTKDEVDTIIEMVFSGADK